MNFTLNVFTLFIILCPSLGMTQPQAANADLRGTILEKGTRTPLAQIGLIVLPMKIRAQTNAVGEFILDDIPVGACTLIINSTGYERLELTDICRKDQAPLKLYLEKVSYNNFETTITSTVKKRDEQTQTLSQEEFIKMPGTFGGDPIRAAQNLPGVAQSGASAQIIIQGAEPDDTGYVIDGHRVPLVFHFGGLSSVLPPEAVERVDLLPSGFGPEYSNSMGGIVGLTTKNPKSDRWHGLASVDFFNAGALIEGPIDQQSSLFLSGRYGYVGQVLKKVAEKNDDFALTAAPSYWDLSSIYQREFNSQNKFKVTAITSRDELELILNKAIANDPELQGEFSSKTQFFRIIPKLSTRLDEKNEMEHSLGIGRDTIYFNIGGRYLDIESDSLTHRSEWIRNWGGRYKTYLGLDNEWNKSEVKVNLPGRYSVGGVSSPFSVGEKKKFVVESNDEFYGVYLRQEIKWREQSAWTFLPNFRYDYFSINNSQKLQPRWQVRWQWDPSLVLRFSLGQYVQAPQPQEVAKNFGNPNVKSPYAIHYTGGFSKSFKDESGQGLDFTNNYFYKDLKNLVISDINSNYSNKGTGKVYGSEIQFKLKYYDWSSQLVYTYLKSRRTIPGYGTTPSQYDQTHNLNWLGSYNLARWTFSGRLRYVTGNPYTPIIGASYDSDNDVFLPKRGPLYSQRFDAYRALDIRVDRKFIYDAWILTAYLDVQNLTNSKNQQNIEYSYDYSENQKVQGLPILPTIGIKGEF